MRDDDDEQTPIDWTTDPDFSGENLDETADIERTALPVAEIKKRAMERPITLEDIEYLFSRFPFLDICNADVREPPSTQAAVKIIQANSGWEIHDRTDRLSAGPGRFVWGAYRRRMEQYEATALDDDEDTVGGDDGGGDIVYPIGTLVKQFTETAIEMIAIAAGRWPTAMVLGGYHAMQRAAWMAAQEMNFHLNYGPTAEDVKIYDSVKAVGGLAAALKSKKGFKLGG